MSAKSPRRRSLKLATLMGVVALIAVGLARVSPWLALRRVHPTYARVGDLFTSRTSDFSCKGCHDFRTGGDILALAGFEKRCALNAGMNVNGKAKDCRACHAP
jgi:hypothetical protein